MDLVTRARDISLYNRMLKSAKETACIPFESYFELDTEGKPEIAKTYNRLARKGKSDIICFVEDDVEFMDLNWDVHVEEIFAEFKPEILGVVGSTKYEGGGYFDSGPEYNIGMCMGSTGVRIISPKTRYTPCAVMDGMTMFVSRKYFEKEQFDETFNGLFYYDIDYCLRSKKAGITSLLMKHSKPPELYGVYPKDMEPIEVFTPAFEKKWGKSVKRTPDLQCCLVSLETFRTQGQTECLTQYKEKYLVKA